MNKFWPTLGMTSSLLTILGFLIMAMDSFVTAPERPVDIETGIFYWILGWFIILLLIARKMCRLKSGRMFIGWFLGLFFTIPLGLIIAVLAAGIRRGLALMHIEQDLLALVLAVFPAIWLAYVGVKQVREMKGSNKAFQAVGVPRPPQPEG